jgi:enoyl-CoA hydratase
MGHHGRIGAVELAAGVPFPSWALEVVRHNVPAGHFQEVVLLGRAYRPDDALRLGLIDEVAAGDVLQRGLEVAREMAQVPRTTYRLTKGMSRAAAVAAAEKGAAETDQDVKAAWNSDEVRAAIRRRIESLGRS